MKKQTHFLLTKFLLKRLLFIIACFVAGPTIVVEATDPTPIPELARWESQMLSYGQQHCDYYDTPGLPFDPLLEHTYYDATRVFYQIASYTNNPAWYACADRATAIYRDGYVIPNNGGVQGYRNFTTGLKMDFERTGNTASKQAAILLSQNTGPARETNPLEWSVTPERSRETAYALISLIDAEALGEPRRARLAELVDLALGHVDQWFISQTYRASMSSDVPAAHGQYYIQPFMVGLTAKALIRYHEHTGDPRVLPAVKTAMDWLWTHAWVAQDHAFWYDNWTPDPSQPFPAKPGAPNTSLLVAPSFAWLYRQTGDAIYRDRGDQVFSGGVTGAWLDGGKQFNQSYMWSFDYIKWRTATSSDTTLPVISSVTASSVTSSGATVTWTTNENADSQVEYGLTTAYGSTTALDATLTASHSQALSGLSANTTYYYRVKSKDAAGNLAVSPGYTLNTLQGGAYEYTLVLDGPHYVVRGNNIFIYIVQQKINASSTNRGVRIGAEDMPPGATYVMPELETAGLRYPNYPLYPGGSGSFQIKVPASTPPGTYNIKITGTIDAVKSSFPYTIIVTDTPSPLQSQPIAPSPIPRLGGWESNMRQWGQYHCNRDTIQTTGTWEGAVWYYDGERVFYQIGDYLNDRSWDACAGYVEEMYRNYVITTNGAIQGYRVFTQGLKMDYLKTGDEESKRAVGILAQSPYAADRSNLSYVIKSGGSREATYALEALIDNEELTGIHRAKTDYLADISLGHIDQWFISKNAPYRKAFMVGLTMEALIKYYEKTGDIRVPGAIKTAADGLWETNWYAPNQGFMYCDVVGIDDCSRTAFRGLNLLIAPAYAWLYKETGDPIYKERGDLAFDGAVAGVPSGDPWFNSGKQFSQNYRWSFDYVKWRTATSVSPTPPSNLTTTPISSSQINLSWNAVSGAAGYTLYRDSNQIANVTSGTSYSDTNLAPATTYSYTISAYDSASNTSPQSSPISATTQSDPTPPSGNTTHTINVSSGTGGTISPLSNITIQSNSTVSFTITPNQGNQIASLTIDGNNITPVTSYTFYNIQSNHSIAAAFSLILSDTEKPSVSITAPQAGTEVSGTIPVTATASDNVGVAGVQFKIDGVNIGAEDTSYPYAMPWNTASFSEGLHRLTAVAKDAQGNTTSLGVSVSVKQTTPLTPLGTPTTSTSPAISNTPSPVSQTSNAALSSDNTETSRKSSGGGGSSGGGSKSDSKKKISEKVIQKQGERTSPFITIHSPKTGTYVGKSLKLSASAKDQSGIQSIVVKVNGTKKKRSNSSSINYSYTNKRLLKNTATTITITAYDTLGNAKTAAIIINGGKVVGVRYY